MRAPAAVQREEGSAAVAARRLVRLSRTWRALGLSAQCVAGALLVRWVVTRAGLDLADVARRALDASPVWLGLGVAAFVFSMVLAAARLRFFVTGAIPIPYLLGVSFVQHAVLSFVPWRIGEVSYPLLLRADHRVPLLHSAAALAVVRTVDLGIVVLVALAGARPLGLRVPGSLIVLGALAGLGLVGGLLYVRRGTDPAPAWGALAAAAGPLARPRRGATFLVLSAALFVTTTVQSMLLLSAVGLTLPATHVAILNATTLLAALVPIHPPGGWGTIDSFQVLVLERLGHAPGPVAAAILAAHSVYTVLILTGGIAGWLLRGTRRPDLARAS